MTQKTNGTGRLRYSWKRLRGIMIRNKEREGKSYHPKTDGGELTLSGGFANHLPQKCYHHSFLKWIAYFKSLFYIIEGVSV